jgi:F-type H+-transporting ATPase subunit b
MSASASAAAAASASSVSATELSSASSSDTAPSEVVTAVTTTLDHLPATASAAGEHTTTAHTEEHGKGGLPQFEMQHWPGQMLWLIVIFAIFYTLMAKVFVPRLRSVVDRRGSQIAEDLANARAIRDEAEAQANETKAEIAAAHTAARKLATEAKARVSAETAAAQAAEDVKLNARLSEDEARIRALRDEAMTHVTDIATDTAQSLIEKLTGKAATKTSLTAALKATKA